MCQTVILLKIAYILDIVLLQCETVKCSVRTTMDSPWHDCSFESMESNVRTVSARKLDGRAPFMRNRSELPRAFASKRGLVQNLS